MKKSILILLTTRRLAVCLVFILVLFSGLTQGEIIALHALEHLGAPYVFHKSGPDKFDCSGLMVHCFGAEGITLGHSAEEIGTTYWYPRLSSKWQLLVGDVVCFDTVKDKDPSDHVGIYLGGGQFVHASSTQHKVVVSDLKDYYMEKFTGARRIACPYF